MTETELTRKLSNLQYDIRYHKKFAQIYHDHIVELKKEITNMMIVSLDHYTIKPYINEKMDDLKEYRGFLKYEEETIKAAKKELKKTMSTLSKIQSIHN